MEKRLLLAISLSFFVLFFWALVNPSSTPSQNKRQDLSLKSKETQDNLSSSLSSAPDVPSAESQQCEELVILDNNKLTVIFSNMGARIKHIELKEYNVSLPITDINQEDFYSNSCYRVLEKTDSFVKYSLEKEGRQIIKKYLLSNNDYLIENSINIKNNSNINIKGFSLDVGSLDKNVIKAQDKALLEYSVASTQSVARKANAYKLSNKDEVDFTEEVAWIGFRDRYFCAIYKPLYKNKGYYTKFQNNKLEFIIKGENISDSSDFSTFDSVLFFGPQDLTLLSSYPYDFKKIVRFSNFGILNEISKIVYKFLHFLYKIIPTWGVCIILTAIFIYLMMYPLSISGMKSMKKIQALQPEILKIKEQHKNNPQKLQKETMELYKKHQVNPFGGCLPLLLQMPFFIGVYQVLWRSVAFKNAKFLWIKDLSQPDHLFAFPTALPFVGEYFNILPILMIIIMIVQQKFSIKNMVVSDPAQESSQKIMMFFFPLMIGFVFYNVASGLALYFTTFYFLSSFTQWKISRIT
ncbi:MAG TPA: membrane protein insertase YidC [Candidatus Omnitrophota bacterium]|nr:membrane protein insertase YidC [Candidatus Omnitrophota bacterium]HPN55272.1 membrane protein insertase YidC [Candidatus Omnitrophota bacterium]